MKFLLFLLSFGITLTAFSQEFDQVVIDKMANDTCNCLDAKESASSNEENIKFLKECMLQQVYKNISFLKENDLDIVADNELGKRLGTQIGLQLAAECEAAMPAYTALGMAKIESDQAEQINDEQELPYFIGKITNVEKGLFPTFKIVDIEGAQHNVLWLTIIDNPALFNEALKGKKNFILEYYEWELYDHRIKEYRNMKVLNAVKTQ